MTPTPQQSAESLSDDQTRDAERIMNGITRLTNEVNWQDREESPIVNFVMDTADEKVQNAVLRSWVREGWHGRIVKGDSVEIELWSPDTPRNTRYLRVETVKSESHFSFMFLLPFAFFISIILFAVIGMIVTR